MELFTHEVHKKLIDRLQKEIKTTSFNGRVFLVGGCIRDSLLKLPIKDIDIAVECEGGGIGLAALLAAKDKSYKFGKNPVMYPKYGTARVVLRNDKELSDITLEIAQTKKNSIDKELGSITEDAFIRDLTINSLYYSVTNNNLYDPTSYGIDDMVNRTLRCPASILGDEEIDKIYQESPIKMLRTIRFSAILGWGIEKNTWLGIIRNSKFITKASQELITEEISKILTSQNASACIRKMLYCGILNKVMPDIYDLTTVYESKNPALTSFDHTMMVLDKVQPQLEVRLAALFHDVGKIANIIGYGVSQDSFSADIASCDLKTMKFSNAVISSVENSIKYHRFFRNYADGIVPPDKKIRKFINECGDNIGNVADLMNANNLYQTYDKKKRQVLDILNRIEELDELEESKNVKLPINGNDIMKYLKLKKGSPIVGKVMEHLKNAYFENPKITKEECFKLIDSLRPVMVGILKT